MIRKYAEIFCWKNVSSFCSAKATHIFSAKNIRILYIESVKIVNEMTLNELVKLTMLWTTGPCLSATVCLPFILVSLVGYILSLQLFLDVFFSVMYVNTFIMPGFFSTNNKYLGTTTKILDSLFYVPSGVFLIFKSFLQLPHLSGGSWAGSCIFLLFAITPSCFCLYVRPYYSQLQTRWISRKSFEPALDKTNKMACAPSEDSDQPEHLPSLSSLRCSHEKSLGL